ncbi:hypothetical protein [Actinacidiphila acidipaludis]|uniref:Uncharacterized protein n=1 Tax=Actinacidiphila acidipaludis TaxID=2873382 RepID=A0ABS7PZY1_9ACTN|nr:hypothetical protein [Streptomyces acidipaludis]MBY8876447.1 hypothetical protein [Streptomyces acidipaludis]
MRAERDIPVGERVLLVENRVSVESLGHVGHALPERAANEEVVFLAYSPADIPVGTRFAYCYRRLEPTDVVSVTATVMGVTQQFGHSWDAIPHGWKTVVLLRFEPEVPAMVRELPEVPRWSGSASVCISDREVWEARS